jgi:type IV pilus assembly protein PilQ
LIVAASASLFLLLLVSASSTFAAEANTLRQITHSALPGNGVEITLTADQEIAQPTSFATESPARIAIDFQGLKSGMAVKSQPVGIGMVRSVVAIEAGDRTRVVVNLVDSVPHDIKVRGKQVVIRIAAGASQTTAKAVASSSEKQEEAPAVSSATRPEDASELPAVTTDVDPAIDGVDFRRGVDGEGRVLISLSDPSTVVDIDDKVGVLVLSFKDVSLPERFERKFDVTDFATPVQMFEVVQKGRDVQVAISAAGEYEHLAYQANDLFAVEFRALTEEEQEAARKAKQVYTGERLSLNFQEIEVRAVLQLLADFTELNMVTSDTVTGTITLRLQNVPWDQALDIILKSRGLGMRKNGNVIMVAPTEEIAAREKLELESQQQIEELAPLFSEYMQVNYAKAEDIATILKSEDNQLLTPDRGNVTVDSRTNMLVVRDTASKLEDIRRLIKKLDVPIRQVLIDSRVVIATDTFAKDIGVRFGFNRAVGEGNSTESMIAGGMTGHLDGTSALDTGTFMGTGASVSNGAGTENLMVNLPSTLIDGGRGGAINLLVGSIGSFLLQLELSAMEQEGKGEIVSSPRVITSDRNKAFIKQGVEIPYQQASASGATVVAFKEAVLLLEVTPQITPDDRIIMDLVINKDEPDFSRAILGVPPVDTREIQTSVLVDNGDTIVLGGVFERNVTKSTEKIPFFGDLPVVGNLFKQNAEQDNNSELLIFVTPKILKQTLGVR